MESPLEVFGSGEAYREEESGNADRILVCEEVDRQLWF
jgi:hypothetical protein